MADLDLKATIELLIKGGNVPKEAADSLRRLATDADKAKKQTTELSTTFSSLKTQAAQLAGIFGAGMGLREITQFVSKAYVEFAKVERQLNTVVAQTQALGGANARTKDEIQDSLDAISAQYGILDDDLIPALNRALLTYKDVSAAQRAIELSARFAANGFGTVQSNAEAIARVFTTGATRSLAEFGIVTKDAGDKTIDAAEAFRLLEEKASSLPSTMGDAQARIDRWRIAADNLSDSIGAATDKLLAFLEASRQDVTNPFAAVAGRILFGAPGANVPGIDSGTGGVGRMQGPQGDPSAALKALFEERAKAQRAAEEKEAAERRLKAKEAKDKEGQDALDARARQFEKERDAYDQFYAGLGEKADDFYRQRAENEQAILEEAQQKLLDFQIEMAERAAEDLRGVDAEAFAVADEQLTELLLIRLQRAADAELAKAEGIAAAERDIKARTEAQKTAIESQHAKARTEIARQEAETKRLMAWQAVASVGMALSAVFEKNKSLAVAATIIDTIAGAQSAFAQTPGPIWVKAAAAAAAALMGFARVQQIRSTTLNGGGGGAGAASGGTTASVSTGGVASMGGDDPRMGRSGYIGNAATAGAAASASSSSSLAIDLRGSVVSDRRSERRLVRRIAEAVERDRSKRVS